MTHTVAYIKKLKSAGFTDKQAEAQAEVIETITEIIEQRVATKKDLIELEERLIYKFTIRIGSMLVATCSLLGGLIKIGN
jgi:hypothetical protein